MQMSTWKGGFQLCLWIGLWGWRASVWEVTTLKGILTQPQELWTVDMVCKKTFTEEGVEQDPRSRWLISQNCWKVASREELGWSWLEEGRFFIWMSKRKSHMLVRGFLFIRNLKSILFFTWSSFFLNISSFKRTSLKIPYKIIPYSAFCPLPCTYTNSICYLFSTLLSNFPTRM